MPPEHLLNLLFLVCAIEQSLGQIKDTLERLNLSAGLGTTWCRTTSIHEELVKMAGGMEICAPLLWLLLPVTEDGWIIKGIYLRAKKATNFFWAQAHLRQIHL